MTVGMRRAAQRGYFVNRSDLVLHGLVIIDVALEGMSYELFHAASQCILCVPPNASEFHSTYNFCWCAVILGLLVGGYRWWALRHTRNPNGPAQSSPSEAASA
jgi:hypothetical protein